MRHMDCPVCGGSLVQTELQVNGGTEYQRTCTNCGTQTDPTWIEDTLIVALRTNANAGGLIAVVGAAVRSGDDHLLAEQLALAETVYGPHVVDLFCQIIREVHDAETNAGLP